MGGNARGLFIATIVLGSFLLFLVQPLVARMVLPRLGGAPAVWNSAMLVYQTLLLGGYAYAHALGRFSLRRQAIIHVALLALAALTLPIALADLPPARAGLETLWVPLLFFATIGPVFFVVSAQAPLMQRWYAANKKAGDPYWLYAASNLGSFAGLLAYPLLLEPNLPLAAQSWLWTFGYLALVLLVAVVGWSRRSPYPTNGSESDTSPGEHVGWRRILLWLALAAVPSGLILSTTTHLTTDIVAMPLLWVLPLGLYLLSFTFAFNEGSKVGDILVRVTPLVILFVGGIAMTSHVAQAATAGLATLLLLFSVSVSLHRRLYKDRPSASQLTLFYLVMSAGGVLGGLFAALLSPMIFDWVWEHPILILAAAILAPLHPYFDWKARFGLARDDRRPEILVTGLAIVLGLGLAATVNTQADLTAIALLLAIGFCGFLLLNWRPGFLLVVFVLMLARGGFITLAQSFEGDRERSYFGIYTVERDQQRATLTHGTTLHGLQRTQAGKEFEPTTYYSRTSGVGLTLDKADELFGRNARVGVVGLGVATMACYRKPAQEWTYFEIDPIVLDYSKSGAFTFMRECTPDATTHLGDARIALEAMEPDQFDILVIDAFSSDAIPLHLVTREAFAIYQRALSDDGIILIHISNRYIDLQPVIAKLAELGNWHSAARKDIDPEDEFATPSLWIAMSKNARAMAQLRGEQGEWQDLPPPANAVWTDDFASILPHVKWHVLFGQDK
ncbi:fused MFS/spermidine synthase [Qipengyuania sphaerica]|uniref:fused MFS/spermidine synthase n=1 Tax=Qipengyuania sphaerica TaxID=2867243 RepID=UPI001C87408D|nr:fused MFS/spermidine synthase [Qipengyuania sphaerica]MBX7541502.1 fused MFS/spermidine synthase [Qipengyuania sphaerica]